MLFFLVLKANKLKFIQGHLHNKYKTSIKL